MVVAELLFAIEQELHESSVDVAEAEEAKIVGVNASPRVGKSPDSFLAANAALRRRSSMVFRASVVQDFHCLFCGRLHSSAAPKDASKSDDRMARLKACPDTNKLSGANPSRWCVRV